MFKRHAKKHELGKHEMNPLPRFYAETADNCNGKNFIVVFVSAALDDVVLNCSALQQSFKIVQG